MRTFTILVLSWTAISDLIELGLGSSSERPPIDLNRSPARSPSPPARLGTTFPREIHPPSRFNPPWYNGPSRSPSSKYSLTTRNIVPPTKLPSRDKRGCGMEYLEFIRLTSKMNPHRVFQLRRYTFPADTELKLIVGLNTRILLPMPTGEQIVISTSNGEIFAILESTNALAGLYMNVKRKSKRAKMNMDSGKVTPLTREEVTETPVGRQRPIHKYFRINKYYNFGKTEIMKE